MPGSTRAASGLRIGGPRRRARAASQYRRTVTRAAATRSSRIVRSRRSTSNGSVVSAAKYSRAIVAIGRPSTRAPRPDFGAAVGARREAASVAAGGSISVRLPRLAPPHQRRRFPPIFRRRRRRASRSPLRALWRSSAPSSWVHAGQSTRRTPCSRARPRRTGRRSRARPTSGRDARTGQGRGACHLGRTLPGAGRHRRARASGAENGRTDRLDLCRPPAIGY